MAPKRPSGDLTAGPLLQGSQDPALVTLYKGWSYLTALPSGDIADRPAAGYRAAGTDFVGRYTLRVNGKQPLQTFAAQTAPHRWTGIFQIPESSREGDLPAGTVPRGSIELVVERTVDAAWTESIRLRNYSDQRRPLTIEIDLECPVDEKENERVLGDKPKSQPGIVPRVTRSGRVRLVFERSFGRRRHAPTEELRRLLRGRAPKDGEPIVRRLVVALRGGKIAIRAGRRTRIRVPIRLSARGHAALELKFVPIIEGRRLRPAPERPVDSTRIAAGNPQFDLMLAQSAADLESLRLPVFQAERDPREALIAGLPLYVGVFCRDVLTAAWQSSLLTSSYLEQALGRIAAYQGVRDDPWRDEEPDRIPHEIRVNPNSAAGRNNRGLYYGDVASTPFWVVSLATAYHWTGDRGLLARHASTLEGCCRWIERSLHEGQGFITYATRSPEGNRHQGWKDSGDAIVDGRGRVQVPPIAAVEIQGYAFMALLAAAEIAVVLKDYARARRWYRTAMALKERFNDSFWMAGERFYAVGLDGHGRRIDSVASNIGHCLGTGIVEKSRREGVVRRLMAPDLFSGWGIRTLSSENPGYDPFSYHRGSVWPVENATIAGSFRLCGFDAEALEVIGGQLSAATWFPRMRLPEVLSGHPRSAEYPIPGLYPRSNLLQAWSVSAIPFFAWVILGLRPVAALRSLFLKPRLPEWLPWLEVDDLRIGPARLGLRCWRDRRGRTRWQVTRKEGRLLVLEQPAELSAEATLWNRLKDALRSAV